MLFQSCKKEEIQEINIGYIGPLSTRATDLGIGPSQAMKLAVKEYNKNRTNNEPKVNLFIEDDKWEKSNALPSYNKLRKEHNIDIVFISNTDGTVAIQDALLKDGVIAINPLNNDQLLASLNENTFMIAKSTEEANQVIGVRMVELDLKNVVIFQYPNDFMSRAANAVQELLNENGVKNKIVTIDKEQVDFNEYLKAAKDDGVDGYAFFGYKELGFAMKQGRDLGIDVPYFGSTTLLSPDFYNNSQGTIIGTECTFFTPPDGNYILAHQFLKNFANEYGEEPLSVWPPMQAYDATNIVLHELKDLNTTKKESETFEEWLRNRLFSVHYYQGICGNISITEDGSSRGIYFSLYKLISEDKLIKVKR
ncbi:ABC transporter substrate-binding protein [Gillisia sp. M10.2A]|uniref:ABC transporter substrate-binding protein n=1 Tax=Gillisia lutea TaxID=2909668 RepID=A0ABS9EFJ8_9FLAO|nr:ABC transporter substrate-binding protein [Gillisia lutea]MCF4101660.1 ABC transporter substrate-binding protein [Gillisia lutea]